MFELILILVMTWCNDVFAAIVCTTVASTRSTDVTRMCHSPLSISSRYIPTNIKVAIISVKYLCSPFAGGAEIVI